MNILDYLDWRGDLSFAASQPNEVDALIFAWLIYYHFEDFEEENFDGMTLAELASLHERAYGSFEKINPATTIDPSMTAAWLLYCASRTERFASVKVCDFLRKQSGEFPEDAGWENQNRGIPKGMAQENQPAGFDAFRAEIQDIQFASVSFILEDGEGELRVIAYRGTDDSIAGWKEDCYLAISDTVPAQKTGLQYLEDTADGRRVLICGHSKGGNLAMYAALFASDNRRTDICSAYNFDGPGFCFDMRDLENYSLISGRIVTIVPESSIVGMLLEHGNDYRIVESRSVGLLQHDALFWQVLGNRFVYTDKRNESSLIADKAIREWIAGMSIQERREFVDALFGILEGTGAVRTTELPEKLVQNGFRNLTHSPVDRGRKKMVLHVLLNLIRAGNAKLYESVKHSDSVRAIIEHPGKQSRLQVMGSIDYYDKNADSFIKNTLSVDFHDTQDKFLSYLSPDSLILDFGCGSGRDTKYFLEHGYRVEAIDGSKEMCRRAGRYTGIPVRQMLFEELNAKDRYDGIWACSSILHLSSSGLPDVMKKMEAALKLGGIIYASFKYGTFEGERNGRYFTDLTEESFAALIQQVKNLRTTEQWITSDARPGRGEKKWLNLILSKV